MKRTFRRQVILLLPLLACFHGMTVAEEQRRLPDAVDEGAIDLRMGGVGGVYFLASPGELIIDVEKRDLNRRGRRTALRAILVGPDRRVIQEAVIPDDGKPRSVAVGPPGRVRLKTRVERKGVYSLNITVSQDRYGQSMTWGFRTNCPHYLIETSRGHRDRAHEEPIVLLNPERPGNVCFMPRAGEFGIELSGLPKADSPAVFDAKGRLVQTLQVDAKGQASRVFPADVHRDAVPWRLHLPVARATIQIDGLTRWQPGDLYANLSGWTPDIRSFFPLLDYRWLITPYKKVIHGKPGEQGEMTFELHNNLTRKQAIEMSLEFPDKPWPAELTATRVTAAGRRSASVAVRYTIPAEGQTRVCHVRATPVDAPEFTTYSTLTATAGKPPATRPLEMPLVLKPYAHENEQFGYLPKYPLDNQVYFDLKNRPFVAAPAGLKVKRGDAWEMADLRTAVRWPTEPKTRRTRLISGKVAFDSKNGVYALGRSGGTSALLHSTDSGRTFSACPISGRGPMDIEQFSGHNTPDGQPPIVRFTLTAADPDRIWRRIHDLNLFLPKLVDGRLSMGEPILISRNCIGLAAHSGIPSSVVSRGSKVHVTWAEATDPAEKVPGVPTFVVTYDRATGKLGKPQLVGHGPPANDVHNTPSITIDSKGFLHVLVGTHGRPFPYARSLKPNDAGGGWTPPELTGENLPETYIGLVCGPDDTLHMVCRFWRRGVEPFPLSHHATLVHQRKPPGKPWQSPEVLIVPPFSEYSVFYHRLTIDRLGRLFISYDYFTTHWFYRTDRRITRRSLMMSPDAGRTWKLVGEEDF